MLIAIIGHGYVGQAVEKVLSGRHQISIKEIGDNYDRANECKAAIICVPTPMMDDGSVDISIVEEAVENLTCELIIIKSTIPPDTTDYLKAKYNKRIVFSPEYIGEGNYPIPYWKGIPHPTDMGKHEFTIFGGDLMDTKMAIGIFKPCFGPFHKYIQTDAVTAELTKYMENTWIATKITFVNEFNEIAKTLGVDYNELRELWLLDKRVSRSHTLISKDRGFDGKCIPKDTNGIVNYLKKRGYEPEFLKEVLRSNKRFKEV